MAELFDTTTGPRVFALPPGADFPDALIDGLITRADGDPALIGRTEIFVNTQRMRRRLRELFDSGPARLVPAAAVGHGTRPVNTPARRSCRHHARCVANWNWVT